MTEADSKQIKAAKAAIGKASPEPWMVRRDDCHFDTMTEIYNGGGIIAETNHEQDAAIIAAAPALVRRVQELEDWQAKALPWLKTKAIDLQDDIDFMEKVWRDEPDSSEWKTAQKWREELKTLTTLIEQAEGGK